MIKDQNIKYLFELLSIAGDKKDVVFIEAGKDIAYGSSVYLDAISLAQYLDADLLVAASGNEDAIFDDIIFFRKQHCKASSLIKLPTLTSSMIFICPKYINWT